LQFGKYQIILFKIILPVLKIINLYRNPTNIDIDWLENPSPINGIAFKTTTKNEIKKKFL
jgi:hypothetical protein